MLHIETRGAWREMGRQIGETFRRWFEPMLDHFAPELVSDAGRHRPAIERIRRVLLAHCPELLEETLGMAEGAAMDAEVMLGLRFFNELDSRPSPGCCGIFIADGKQGPLLGRTCDIEPDISVEIQLCRIRRPDEGPAAVVVTYLPITGGIGFNEHGLAIGGSSAPALVKADGEGLPTAVVNHLLLTRCRNVGDAGELLRRLRIRGKAALEIICDESGDSMLVEMASGHEMIIVPRAAGRNWQASSNICYSGKVPARDDPRSLGNAYARYGRIAHQLDGGFVERSVGGLKRLIADVTQPGPVCPEEDCYLHTAYANIIETRSRRMHVCPGHPAKAKYMVVSL